MPRAMPAPPSAPSTAPVSMPAPNVNPPAARSAASPVSAPDTTPPIIAALPSFDRRVELDTPDRRSRTSCDACPSRPWIAISRSVDARMSVSRRAASAWLALAFASSASLSRSPIALPRSVKRSLEARVGQRFAVAGGARDRRDERVHRLVELRRAAAPATRARVAHTAARFVSANALPDDAQQRDLLHPAARERIERNDRAHERTRAERVAPARLVRFLLVARPRLAGLVEQHDDRLADPLEHGHLRRQVAGVLGRFGRVDEVEHDVGLVANVRDRLLRQPERAVAKAIPDLREEPADRIALLRESLRKARAVAEARRVPEDQRIAFGRVDHRIGRRLERDVRRVAHFADVAAEQRARERRLARVRVRDQRQRDCVGVAHDACSQAAIRSLPRPPRDRDAARFAKTGSMPASANSARQSLRRSSSRRASTPLRRERRLVDEDEHRLRPGRCAQALDERAMRFAFRRRGQIEQRDRRAGVVGQRSGRQCVLPAIVDRRCDDQRCAAAERATDDRLQAGQARRAERGSCRARP